MKKHFLSFGNERFKKSRVRIAKEANDLNIFDNIIIETEDICQEEPFKVVADKILSKYKTTGRGYFWYMWKPYIIYKTLKSLGEGDVIFYCDSGMTIINTSDRINKFKYLLKTVQDKEKCPTGIITFITTGPQKDRLEYMYNLIQVFKHFNVENNDDITKTQQYQAGILVFVKCSKSMEIVEKWFSLTQTHPEYFIGDYRFCDLIRETQIPGYRDHRHDQSIWSILCKLNNVTVYNHDKNPIYQSHKRE